MRHGRPFLLFIAASERGALIAELRRYRAMPIAELVTSLGQRAFTGSGPERLAIVAEPDDIPIGLDLAIERLPSLTSHGLVARARGVYFASGATPGRIAFLFPGQGSEHAGMLQTLYARVPVVRAWFDALDRAAFELGEPRLTPVIFDDASHQAPERPHAHRRRLYDMKLSAQLGTVADLAMYDVLRALGVHADVHVGHSNGEHAAVIAAGMIADATPDALCRGFVSLARSVARLGVPSVPEGMLAVSGCPPDRLASLLRGYEGSLHLAMDNCPTQLIVGGLAKAIDPFSRDVVDSGGIAIPLPFSRAYHTPLFTDWASAFAAHYREWSFGPGHVDVYSCFTVQPLPGDSEACRQTMADQLTSLVQFRSTLGALYDEGVRTFIEVGPDSRLTTFVDDTLRGRPHLAVSAASTQRGDIEQLGHLMGELFVTGLDVDPSALDRLLLPVLNAARTTAVDVHLRLIARARERLAHAAALVRNPDGDPGSGARHPAGDVGPLLGSVTVATPTRLSTCRHFTRRADRFVDDHALGRWAPQFGGYPLPVLPFTLGLEVAAEAARCFTGMPAAEIVGARASRWLALDGGELSLDVEADGEADRVRVRLTETGATVPGAAFEANVSTYRQSTIRVDRDPLATMPNRWNADAFYERYAFHGPGFRGLSRVLAVGPRGIEADLTITSNLGLPLPAMQLDPAMLDCAGQLVAFWLLEHHQRLPTFGIFPFTMRRVTIERPPLAAGTTVRCRGTIAFDGGTTDASFVFETLEGTRVAAIDGLTQRLIELPRWLASLIFGEGEELPRAESARPAGRDVHSIDDRNVLTSSWGIWERALAHLCLAPGDFTTWRNMPFGDSDRLNWLLSHAAIERRPATMTDR